MSPSLLIRRAEPLKMGGCHKECTNSLCRIERERDGGRERGVNGIQKVADTPSVGDGTAKMVERERERKKKRGREREMILFTHIVLQNKTQTYKLYMVAKK